MRDELEADPEDDGPGEEQRRPNSNFDDGRVMNRLKPLGPCAENAAFARMTSISTVRAVARPNSIGREKKIVKSCTWALDSVDRRRR